MESNHDVLNRIHANFTGIGKNTEDQIEEDFATIRAALRGIKAVDVEELKFEIYNYLDKLYKNPITINQGTAIDEALNYLKSNGYVIMKAGE